jgi:hypothetical protein
VTKWYALNWDGAMIYLGEFETIEDVDSATGWENLVWIVSETDAKKWSSQLQELLA